MKLLNYSYLKILIQFKHNSCMLNQRTDIHEQTEPGEGESVATEKEKTGCSLHLCKN